MKQFLITVLGVLIGMILFLVVAPIFVVSMLSSSMGSAPAQPNSIVVALDLREDMSDQPVGGGPALFGANPSLLETLAKIDAAADDDRVKGLYIRANTAGMPPAHAEELRAALAAFRASGKFVISHLQNDSVRMSLAGYYAASAADEVWLQETGEVMPMGIAAEVDFFGATLERFRVQAEVEAREEFKTFANIFTEDGFTPAHREETTGLLNSLFDVMVAGIGENRNLTPDAVRAAIAATPFTAARAIELRLVDQLGRPEDAERAALTRAGGDAEIVDMAMYSARSEGRGPVIAVVQGEGEIVSGLPDDSPFASTVMNSDSVARAILDAAEDEDVRAIVFRVSSPGGSVVASDQILHAIRTAQEAGKRVVVSMGPVAASGGYYVSASADEIVANRTTITGSIGVVGAKITFGPALDHYFSVRTETVEVGSELSDWFSPARPFSQAERAAFAGMIDRMYTSFVGLVAEGRDLTPEQAREVAKGRVWTGEQALERRLVDHIGGFMVAVDRAKALAGIEADQQVQLRFFPEQLTPVQELQRFLGASGQTAEAGARLNAALSDPRIARALDAIARDEDESAAQARTHDMLVR